ncbi:RHS repeat-associated core domain-containing protein [Thiovibrio sp. JS02]
MYFYRARYYDPQVGRFISKDPIGFAGGDVVLYGYVQNNPVNFVDPSGNVTLLGGGVGMRGHFALFGASVSRGGVAGSDGCRCEYVTVCGRIGPGLVYLGGGLEGSGGLSSKGTRDLGGWSVGGGADIGWGPSAGVNAATTNGTTSTVNGSAGLGWGASSGVDFCYTVLECGK